MLAYKHLAYHYCPFELLNTLCTYLPNWTPVNTSGTKRQNATRAFVKLGDALLSDTALAPVSKQLHQKTSREV